MKFSIVIASYNDRSALFHMLQSLAMQSFRDFETIVADDGSSDDSVKIVSDFRTTQQCNYPLQVAVQKDTGWRLAAVRNLGSTLAQGDFIVYIDGDQFCDADLLSWYSKKTVQPCAIAGVRDYVANRRNGNPNEIIKKPIVIKKDRRPGQKKIIDGPVSAFQVWGCNCAVARTIWDELGGFDESFTGWGCEETDFFLRVERAGYPIYGCPKAIVYHFPEIRSRPAPIGRRYWREVKRFDESLHRNDGKHKKDVIEISSGIWQRIE